MILELIEIGFLVGSFVYHRLNETGPIKTSDRLTPRLADGESIPLIYGRCRVRSPLISWYGNASAVQRIDQPDGVFFFEIDMTLVLGIPFRDGIVNLCGVYLDDHPIPAVIFSADGLPANVGGSTYLFDNSVGIPDTDSRFTSFPYVEFGDGNSGQTMVGSLLEGSMVLAGVDASLIPGYRGYMTFHVADLGRNDKNIPVLHFEVSSYPSVSLDEYTVGLEANPADVLYDLLKGTFGKLGLDYTLVDYETFRAAAEALNDEEHGYSRAIEDSSSADEIISDILKQIDAVMYEDPIDSKIKLKLIRGDYDPTLCRDINPETCERIDTPAAGGWTGRVNKIRVVFPDRDSNYAPGSATAHNQANAVGQNGLVEELVIQMPGVCTQALANDIAGRELAARSRPMFKCTAIVDRSFLRTVPGDVVSINWPDWHISGMLMRVAGVTRGSLQNGAIKLELIQDFFYSRRAIIVEGGDHGTIGSFPTDALFIP